LGVLLFALIALLVMALAGGVLDAGTKASLTGAGNPFRQTVYFGGVLLTIWAIRPLDQPKRLLAVPVMIVIALGWCLVSLTWAIDPAIAARRLLLTAIIIWQIFMATQQLGYARTVGVLRWVMAGLLLANFVTVLLFPEIGIHQPGEVEQQLTGNWRGVLEHKNFAGAACAMTILLFVFDAKRIPMAIRAVVIAASVVFLYFSVSKTSMGLIGFSLAAGFLFQRYNARYRAALIIALFLVALVSAILVNILRDPLAANLSDANALTGRVQIWWMLTSYASDHWLLGSGYGSFWDIGSNSPVFHYGKGWVTELAAGHNGFLDLLVQIGLPGVILVVVAVFIEPMWRLLTRQDLAPSHGALLISLLLFEIAHNTTETSIFSRDSIVEVCLMLTIALIGVAPGPLKSSVRRSQPPSTPQRAKRWMLPERT
jgi:O-antigen ligase